MKLNIIVHDCFPNIGHTKAMLEIIKNWPTNEIKEVQIVCYTAEDKEILFPNESFKVSITKVPFPKLKPFLLKSIFFQIYTWLKKAQIKTEGSITITIGACSFIGDFVNIQFYHHSWEKLYHKVVSTSFLKGLYKKILLRYLSLCETFYYRKKDLKFIFLSKFIKDDMIKKFSIKESNYRTAYSSVDTQRFYPSKKERQILISELKAKYSALKNLDEDKPITLFAGAYERKGLGPLLEQIPDNQQLIVLGAGETRALNEKVLKMENVFAIPFTTEIELFFQTCDCFVFPTFFEPFGLVVLEAFATGINLCVTKDKVGASEIIEGFRGVQFIDPKEMREPLENITILRRDERQTHSHQRAEVLRINSWKRSAEIWEKFITS